MPALEQIFAVSLQFSTISPYRPIPGVCVCVCVCVCGVCACVCVCMCVVCVRACVYMRVHAYMHGCTIFSWLSTAPLVRSCCI